MKYLAVTCLQKNNRCFVLLISALAREGEQAAVFFYVVAAEAAADGLIIQLS